LKIGLDRIMSCDILVADRETHNVQKGATVKQALDQSRQDEAVVREFVESFVNNFAHAERIWKACPDLHEKMHRANCADLDATFEAKGGIAQWLD